MRKFYSHMVDRKILHEFNSHVVSHKILHEFNSLTRRKIVLPLYILHTQNLSRNKQAAAY